MVPAQLKATGPSLVAGEVTSTPACLFLAWKQRYGSGVPRVAYYINAPEREREAMPGGVGRTESMESPPTTRSPEEVSLSL